MWPPGVVKSEAPLKKKKNQICFLVFFLEQLPEQEIQFGHLGQLCFSGPLAHTEEENRETEFQVLVGSCGAVEIGM